MRVRAKWFLAAGALPAGWLVMAVLIAAEPQPGPAKPAEPDSPEKDYSAELPRIPRVSPTDAMKTFQVQPGFRIEQIAAEPLLTDPVAISIDENGRAYVVEMRGYSEDGDEGLGLVRLLEDTTGDGRFNKSTVFLGGLKWPTAVACYDGGVLVGQAPDLIYAKDTTGDGRADRREVVFTGFGRTNVQGMLNSLQWGLDNRIHGAASSCGGAIKSLVDPEAPPVSVQGRDFAIEPRSMKLQATSGGAQHGMSFDRWGTKFVCSNSDHAQLVMFEDRYIARNPFLAAPGARRSIAADGRQADVFRTSPVEPWRIVRTRLRVSGVVKGIVEGGGRPAGYFSGATGAIVYRGDAFPPEYQGNLFVADCGSNLVHRKVLEPSGVEQIARRADEGREFLASSDIWFRPVQHANAPDGTLWVLDMSREVIEHPHSIPPMIKKHLDLTSGRDQGRLYRIVPEGFKQPPPPRLGSATTAELVALLGHTNGWHRETASRLLYERQDPAAVGPLEELSLDCPLAEGRIHALYALDGLNRLSVEVLLPRLDDEHPRVREHAVRLSERLAQDAPALRSKLYNLVADDELRVRYQLAFSLGELTGRQRNLALARLARRDAGDPWVRVALLSSLAEGAGEVFAQLVADESFRREKSGTALLEALAQQIGAQQRPGDLAAVLKGLQELPDGESATAQAIVRGATRGAGSQAKALQDQWAAATGGKADKLLADLLADATKTALDADRPEAERAEAVRSLGIGAFSEVGSTLVGLVDHRQPNEVQLAALSTLGRFNEPAVAQALVEAFPALSPRLRSEALETIFSRSAWLAALLDALEGDSFPAALVDAARVRLLLAHPDAAIQSRAQKVFAGLGLKGRADVIASYRQALELDGDPGRGRTHFRKVCAACHRLEEHGHEVGIDLSAIRNKGPEAILIAVLDPNREVDPKYLTYQALTNDGRTFSGIIAAETATSVTLRRAEGATDTLLRIDIDLLRSNGLSMMPEGLEKELDPQGLADVIAYLLSLQ